MLEYLPDLSDFWSATRATTLWHDLRVLSLWAKYGGWFKIMYLNFFFTFILFLRVRESQSTSGGGAERGRETQNPKQAPGFELSAQRLMRGLN